MSHKPNPLNLPYLSASIDTPDCKSVSIDGVGLMKKDIRNLAAWLNRVADWIEACERLNERRV